MQERIHRWNSGSELHPDIRDRPADRSNHEKQNGLHPFVMSHDLGHKLVKQAVLDITEE